MLTCNHGNQEKNNKYTRKHPHSECCPRILLEGRKQCKFNSKTGTKKVQPQFSPVSEVCPPVRLRVGRATFSLPFACRPLPVDLWTQLPFLWWDGQLPWLCRTLQFLRALVSILNPCSFPKAEVNLKRENVTRRRFIAEEIFNTARWKVTLSCFFKIFRNPVKFRVW